MNQFAGSFSPGFGAGLTVLAVISQNQAINQTYTLKAGDLAAVFPNPVNPVSLGFAVTC